MDAKAVSGRLSVVLCGTKMPFKYYQCNTTMIRQAARFALKYLYCCGNINRIEIGIGWAWQIESIGTIVASHWSAQKQKGVGHEHE
jgi:hypothetical protein